MTPQTKNATDRLIQELRSELGRLRWENLRQRLEIEQLTEWPMSRAANRIRRKYQRRRDKYTERYLTIKN